MFEKQISQSLQDAIKKITSVSEALVGSQHRIDKNKNGKVDAHDFKLLKGQKAAPMKEDPDWVIIEQDEDNTTAKVAGHKVTLHRSLSEPGTSDTYTLHHPSGDKKVKISYGTHGDGEEVHGDKVNHAFGLDSKHKLGHKIAGSMSGMGGISKFEESVEQTDEAMSHQAKTTMKHIPNASPALKKAAKDIKPGIAGYQDRVAMLKAGGVKEEAEIDEAYQTAKSEFVARQGRLTAAAAETEKDPARLKRMSNIPGYSAAMDLAKKTTQGAKHTKEEVEQMDELSKTTLGSYAKKATRDAVITRKIGADFEHQGKRAKSSGSKAASDELSQKYKSKSWQRRDGVDKAVDRLTKEEIELGEAKSLHKMSADELDQAHKNNEAKIAAIHKNDPTERITKSHPLISKRRSINLHKVIRSKQTNEEVEESIDETIIKHDSFTVEIKESYSFADYLTAAKQLVGEDEAVAYANEAFKTQDLTIFIMEEMSRGDIEDNINAHRKAGHTVTMPKYSTKDGKPHAEYTVTDKDEGIRRKYIHHGNVRKVENMGAKG